MYVIWFLYWWFDFSAIHLPESGRDTFNDDPFAVSPSLRFIPIQPPISSVKSIRQSVTNGFNTISFVCFCFIFLSLQFWREKKITQNCWTRWIEFLSTDYCLLDNFLDSILHLSPLNYFRVFSIFVHIRCLF